MPERVTRVVPHLAAVALYAGLAVLLTWPLAAHLREGMLGASVGDNATFVWNFWWVKQAIANGQSPLWTSALFAPIGTSLVLHTTTLLPTAVATVLVGPVDGDPLVVYNAAVIATVFLNGVCTYGAAYAMTRQPMAAIVAGLVFSASPFLTARLQGHFNVLSAWGLPLLVIALVRCSRGAGGAGGAQGAGGARGAGGAGGANALLVACALAVLAYTDYYYFVFGLVLASVYLLLRYRRFEWKSMALTPARHRMLRVLLTIGFGLTLAIMVIALVGGVDLFIDDVYVGARSTFNLRGALWVVALVGWFVWKWPHVRLARVDLELEPRPWRPIVAGAGLMVLLLPLILEGGRLIANNDYASQTYLWRSAPRGIDVGALVLGNPFHPLYGSWVRAIYAHLGIDPVEGVAWLGLVPMACFLLAASRLRAQAEVQRWMLVTGLFFVWALGPYLVTFGANSGFVLPQMLLRVVPLLANARIPGRAFVMVVLGVALIASLVLASEASFVLASDASLGLGPDANARRLGTPTRARGLTRVGKLTRTGKLTRAGLAAALVLIDYWPAQQAFVALDRPALYQTLRTLPPGPVLDLPLGIRDGFGERGHLDHRALFYQTLHEHPLGGGFVGRLSPRVRRAYEQDPVLGALLSDRAPGSATGLGGGGSDAGGIARSAGGVGSASAHRAGADSLACAFRYLVLPKTSPASTREIVERTYQLEHLGSDDVRDLYRVTGCTPPGTAR